MTLITSNGEPSPDTQGQAVPPTRHATRQPGRWLAWLVGLLLASMLGTLLFLSGYLVAGAGAGAGCSAASDAFEPFCDAYERLKSDYVDPLDDAELAEGALRGLFDFGVGDPYSAYMPPDVYETALSDLSGRFEGIGAEMAVENHDDPDEGCTTLSETCVLVVVAPLPDSPAEEAGLRSGDIVRSVDGESVVGSTQDEQINRVRGPAGTQVTLGIQRGEERFDLSITRAEIVIQEVEARIVDPGVGYIRLRAFSDHSSGEFRDGLAGLLDDGAEQIVFDLRNNPGGYILAAQEIASQFIDRGIIFTQESHGDPVKEWTAQSGGVATDPEIEVVVLTNQGSASASEIVAAALQERGRATVIGQPTYGKNTVQIWVPLEDSSGQSRGGMRMTISRWFTPDHRSVEEEPKGVQPDIVVDVPPSTPADGPDLVLERAIAYLERTAGSEDGADAAADDESSTLVPARLVAYEPEARVLRAA